MFIRKYYLSAILNSVFFFFTTIVQYNTKVSTTMRVGVVLIFASAEMENSLKFFASSLLESIL